MSIRIYKRVWARARAKGTDLVNAGRKLTPKQRSVLVRIVVIDRARRTAA